MIEGSLQRLFSTVATLFDHSLSRCLRGSGLLTRSLPPMWTRFLRRRRKIIIMLALVFGVMLHHSDHSFDAPKYEGGVLSVSLENLWLLPILSMKRSYLGHPL